MEVIAVKTHKIVTGDSLIPVLDKYLPALTDKDIILITSKIVSICEGRIITNDGQTNKYDLIKQEADKYIQTPEMEKYHIILTVKNGSLIASAGIDESNGNGNFILWPQNPFKSAADIWTHLKTSRQLNNLAVIITDSRTIPTRWGTTGFGIAWCGFEPLKSYIGKPDIFGRNLKMTKASLLDGLSASAVTVMGEGNEQTPIAVIRYVPAIIYQNHPPTAAEIEALQIDLEDDIYAPLINSPKWQPKKK